MRHLGQRQRASRKKRRRFQMWRTGPDVSGGFAHFGPFGKRHGERFHRWQVREHLSAVRKAAHAPSEKKSPGEPIPKTGGTTVGPGSGTAPLQQ